jgi:hypothetical protein
MQAVSDIWKRSLQPLLSQPGALERVGPEFLVGMARNASPALQRYPDDQILDCIRELHSPGTGGSALPVTSEEQRAAERKAIIDGLSDEDQAGRSLFQSEPVGEDRLAGQAPLLRSSLARLCLVHRLREVRALRGFQRLSPAPGDPYTSPCAPLARSRTDWLPAVQVYGEGIYFELSPQKLSEWGARLQVQIRCGELSARYGALHPRGGDAWQPSPPFLLVHTLTHLLINQLALDCGYSSSSLRERIYVGRDPRDGEFAGALIYTSSSASDGTLGGLVRQGQPDLFERTLAAAIDNARWCSSDPLCIDSRGQGVDALNLAACHACAIVSETSCEQRNLLLDRALIIGMPADSALAFFADHNAAMA